MGFFNLWGHERTRRAVIQNSVNPDAAMHNDQHLAALIDRNHRLALRAESTADAAGRMLTTALDQIVDDRDAMKDLQVQINRLSVRINGLMDTASTLNKRMQIIEDMLDPDTGERPPKGLSDEAKGVQDVVRGRTEMDRCIDGEILAIIEEATVLLRRWDNQVPRHSIATGAYADLITRTRAWLEARP
jgi:hypothetical protein